MSAQQTGKSSWLCCIHWEGQCKGPGKQLSTVAILHSPSPWTSTAPVPLAHGWADMVRQGLLTSAWLQEFLRLFLELKDCVNQMSPDVARHPLRGYNPWLRTITLFLMCAYVACTSQVCRSTWGGDWNTCSGVAPWTPSTFLLETDSVTDLELTSRLRWLGRNPRHPPVSVTPVLLQAHAAHGCVWHFIHEFWRSNQMLVLVRQAL